MTRAGGTALPALLLALLLLPACGQTPDQQPDGPATGAGGEVIQVVDAMGDTVRLDGPPSRVVSLVPSATLTLDALGVRSRLVGRTDYDTLAWARTLPSVGGGLEPNLEDLVALTPDLVIRFGGDQDPVTPRRLDELGIPHAAVRPDAVADVFRSIRVVGALVGEEVRADSLARHLEARLDSLRRARRGGPSPRVAYLLGGEPPWVAGPGTYIHELVELVGGTNVFADLDDLYASVSLEEFLVREIDVVVTHGAEELRGRLPGDLPIREVGGALELPGPWVVEAAHELDQAVHGGPPGARR